MENKKFIKTKGLTLLTAFFTLALFFIALSPRFVKADNNYAHDGKVTICHATASDSNPYVKNTPNIENNGDLNGGHLNHTGGIYPSAN